MDLPLPRCKAVFRRHLRKPALPPALQPAIRDNAQKNNGSHDGEIERAWDTEHVDEVLQNLKQDRAEHDAED